MKKLLCLILALCCALCCLAGCDTVKEITANVLEAAKEELVSQLKATLEEYKVDVLEVKPLTGQVGDGGDYQFFCAVLIQTNSESSAEDCAGALKKVFGAAGYMAQETPEVDCEYLIHRSVTYSRDDYSAGNYYTVYAYAADLTKLVDIDAIQAKLTGG